MPPNDAESLARPNGNATGFLAFDYSISAKWLELLKEISSNVVRVGVLRNPAISAAIGQFAVIQATAPSLGVEVSALNIHRHSEIPGVIAGFARGTNDGLIVTASVFAVRGRDLIIADAAKRRLATATTDFTLLMPEGLFPMALVFATEGFRCTIDLPANAETMV